MSRRQRIPRQWLIIANEADRQTFLALRRMPRGSGVLLLERSNASGMRQLRTIVGLRDLTIISEADRTAARVHNLGELKRALLQRTQFIFLSPLYRTRSHPDWQPLPRMRAATLARLAKRSLLALGGMNDERYSRVEQLGFIGWAGISAFRT